MKLESFDDVLSSINKKKSKRSFHLLLGNGFSMAYDPNIFSYGALGNFVERLDDEVLKTLFAIMGTKNFELVMQQLDNFEALIDSFGTDKKLKAKIESANQHLKESLIGAVEKLHPEHVFEVPQERSDACAGFLKTFLDAGGQIYTTNYDLLLYWVLMRNEVVRHVDGFGRDRIDSGEEYGPEEDAEYSDLRWGKHRDEQNVFYLHGTLPFFDTGVEIVKEEYTSQSFLLQNIRKRMGSGEYPIFVTAGNGREKLEHIMHNRYLTHCYESLCEIEGSLVTFGFNFGEYDDHIVEAVNRAAKFGKKSPPRLWSIYIGVYSDEDRKHIESIERKFHCKVHIYDAKSVSIWSK